MSSFQRFIKCGVCLPDMILGCLKKIHLCRTRSQTDRISICRLGKTRSGAWKRFLCENWRENWFRRRLVRFPNPLAGSWGTWLGGGWFWKVEDEETDSGGGGSLLSLHCHGAFHPGLKNQLCFNVFALVLLIYITLKCFSRTSSSSSFTLRTTS